MFSDHADGFKQLKLKFSNKIKSIHSFEDECKFDPRGYGSTSLKLVDSKEIYEIDRTEYCVPELKNTETIPARANLDRQKSEA